MGRDVPDMKFSGEDRRRYREKIRQCLDAFAQLLRESRFDFDRPLAGLEIELNLVDERGEPAMKNAEVLDTLADPTWCTEIGQFNLEINVPPRRLTDGGPGGLEELIRTSLNSAETAAKTVGVHTLMIGILPTLHEKMLNVDALSANPRYRLLNDQIFAARGEDLMINIEGAEKLLTHADSVAPEAACTSVQFHLQVSPRTFASFWNAAQAIAGVQVALGANSPYLFGKQLWSETRIPLFEQATDTRPEELKAQGVRPRVWFGDRWVTSVFDLFEENVRYFPALLPICDDEDPFEVIQSGQVPRLPELTLHNGTIWRWNRPVYAVVDGTPHLRVENRVLPAGPTVIDIIANSAFYYGLVRALVETERPIWTQMSFAAARENLLSAARNGINARLFWPGIGDISATDLVLRRLLPLASEGLDRWVTEPAERDRLLGIIEQRCLTRRNGATWQTGTVQALTEKSPSLSRHEALREMTLRYIELMHTNEPVHTWPVG